MTGQPPSELDIEQARLYATELAELYYKERELRKELEEAYKKLEASYFNTMRALVAAIEAKDSFTEGHSERVRDWSLVIAQEMGLDKSFQKKLSIAAILHDVGKISLPGSILNKPGKLTDAEYKLVQTHVETGVQIVRQAGFDEEIQQMIAHHHEYFDGSGYPQGLSGSDISVGGRILALVDSFEAMISYRPYRPAMSVQSAVKIVRAASGSQFDPESVRYFLHAIREHKLHPSTVALKYNPAERF